MVIEIDAALGPVMLIIIYLTDVRYESMAWIELIHNEIHWRAFINTVMNHQVK
jgi:hypothetical protein